MRESKAGLSEGEGGGVAGFFSRKRPVTDSLIARSEISSEDDSKPTAFPKQKSSVS
jgi:hypothetical protein